MGTGHQTNTQWIPCEIQAVSDVEKKGRPTHQSQIWTQRSIMGTGHQTNNKPGPQWDQEAFRDTNFQGLQSEFDQVQEQKRKVISLKAEVYFWRQ